MNYDKIVFNRLRNIHKLPQNRRFKGRRNNQRRSNALTSKNDRRSLNDRRIFDRRAIKEEIIVRHCFSDLISKLYSLELLIEAFPNIRLNSKKSLGRTKFIIDWEINLPDGKIQTQTEVEYDTSKRFLFFNQCKGDFQKLHGIIEFLPQENGTKICVDIIIEAGLPTFEAILGDVFKNKIRSIIKAGLQRFAHLNGGQIESNSDFGFLIHTIPDYFATSFSDTTYAKMPEALFKFLLQKLPPFKSAHVTGIKSITGATTEGDLIFSPLAPSHFLTLNKEYLLNHIIEAGSIAKDLGAKLLGLGAYTAFVGKRGVEISSILEIPVTTGTAYTIGTALLALEDAAIKSGLKLHDSCVTIVGATGSIGKTCAELLAAKVGKLVLHARNSHRLNQLLEKLKTDFPHNEISTTTDTSTALSQADLILLSTNTPDTFIDIAFIKPGGIICDISQPRNVSIDDSIKRKDILVIDGGVVEPPGKPNFNIYFGLPQGLAYACLGETMILALEKRYESFSIGGNISPQKVIDITSLGEKHGFRLAELKSFGQIIQEEKFEFIQSYRN